MRYCINCGLNLSLDMSPQVGNKCPTCCHDQRSPVPQKTTNIEKFINSTMIFCENVAEKYIDEHFSDRRLNIEESRKDSLHSLFTFSNLAIAFLIVPTYYGNNGNLTIIKALFETEIDKYLSAEYGEDHFKEAKRLFYCLVQDYTESFQEENYLKKISNVLQYHAESIMFEGPILGMKFAFSSDSGSLNYFLYITSFIQPLVALMNKWDIK